MENKEEIPRVSRILDVVDWGIQKAPGFILRRYGKYGTSFHELARKKIKGERTRVSPRFKQKWKNFEEWLKQYEVIESEKEVYWEDSQEPSRRYRGTLDLILKEKFSKKTYLADIKTGKFYKRHWYQLSAYKNAYGGDVDEMMLVRPTEEGVDIHQVPDRTKGFLNILDIYYDTR